MNKPENNQIDELIARAVRGELKEAERRDLEHRMQLDSDLRDRFEMEQSLEQLLERLPNAPVATNFTSRVMQAVAADQRSATSSKRAWWRIPFVRLATGLSVVTIAGVLSLNEYRKSQRNEMVRSVASFTEIASAMSPEDRPALAFRDFDAIANLSVPAESELDLELLVALQK
ncbi:MAG TPA: hypothetical protein VF773_03945 [Verrucomicrobiae bacterium]